MVIRTPRPKYNGSIDESRAADVLESPASHDTPNAAVGLRSRAAKPMHATECPMPGTLIVHALNEVKGLAESDLGGRLKAAWEDPVTGPFRDGLNPVYGPLLQEALDANVFAGTRFAEVLPELMASYYPVVNGKLRTIPLGLILPFETDFSRMVEDLSPTRNRAGLFWLNLEAGSKGLAIPIEQLKGYAKLTPEFLNVLEDRFDDMDKRRFPALNESTYLELAYTGAGKALLIAKKYQTLAERWMALLDVDTVIQALSPGGVPPFIETHEPMAVAAEQPPSMAEAEVAAEPVADADAGLPARHPRTPVFADGRTRPPGSL